MSSAISIRKASLKLVVLLGVVSLFADIATTGARSIIGPYFAVLGANAAIVGIVTGLGQGIGYGFRFLAGYFADHYRIYWPFISLGYFINLIAVPILALAGYWQIAALFLIIERFGKAIRTSPRDALLSYATQKVGRGKGFGIHKMLDQVGAMIGPILVAMVLFLQGGFRTSFLILFIPAAIGLTVLFYAQVHFQHPRDLESSQTELNGSTIPRVFWLYLVGSSLVAAGFADFPLIGFHFEQASILPIQWIPILYALALGVSGLVALWLGYLFDHNGTNVLVLLTVVSSLFAPLVFLGHLSLAVIGMILWGVGMGAQLSLMRAIIARIIPKRKRGVAYGLFNGGYGLAWFLGSSILGILYDVSLIYLVIFSLVLQLSAIPLFFLASGKKTFL